MRCDIEFLVSARVEMMARSRNSGYYNCGDMISWPEPCVVVLLEVGSIVVKGVVALVRLICC